MKTAIPAHARRDTLHHCLRQATAWNPTYKEGLANHLPMVLHAAWELGADSDRLQAQVDRDSAMLEPTSPSRNPLADWRLGLGRREAYPDLRIHFEQKLVLHGTETTLSDTLPILAPGLTAHAFHGLIRCAHAYESGCLEEIAASLAAWSSGWHSPSMPRPADKRLPWDDWLHEIQPQLETFRSDLRLIQARMAAAEKSPLYQQRGAALAFAPNLPARREQFLDLALNLYLRTRNFTVLHMITALRALRILSPFLPDNETMQDIVTRSALLAMISDDPKPHGLPQTDSPPHWDELKRRACAQQNDHVVKLVHACWQEDGLRADPRWRKAAALALHGRG